MLGELRVAPPPPPRCWLRPGGGVRGALPGQLRSPPCAMAAGVRWRGGCSLASPLRVPRGDSLPLPPPLLMVVAAANTAGLAASIRGSKRLVCAEQPLKRTVCRLTPPTSTIDSNRRGVKSLLLSNARMQGCVAGGRHGIYRYSYTLEYSSTSTSTVHIRRTKKPAC